MRAALETLEARARVHTSSALGAAPLPRLLLMSVFSLALLTARVLWTHGTAYSFLAWNLFLAWIPFALALALERLVQRRARPLWLGLTFVPWLLFLPNAPYIVTDLVHLRFRQEAPVWFDAVMLMTFAWTGLALGVAALRRVSCLVRARWGKLRSATFVICAALASGYGIYLGRFSRLNSWDLATHPGWALREVASPLVHPIATIRAWNVTITQAVFFLVVYGTMEHFGRVTPALPTEPQPPRPRDP